MGTYNKYGYAAEQVKLNIYQGIKKVFLISISLTLIEGVENEGYQRQRNNLGSLSRKNCRPSQISTRDQAIHQVDKKKRKETFLLLQELLRQRPVLCNAWRRLKLWNRDRISLRYKPDSRFNFCLTFPFLLTFQTFVINRTPETEAAVILVWINDMKDLWKIQEAAYKTNRSTSLFKTNFISQSSGSALQ